MGLKDIYLTVKKDKECYEERTGVVQKPPYSADAPCYYCLVRDEVADACDYCIQNPDAVIYGWVRHQEG